MSAAALPLALLVAGFASGSGHGRVRRGHAPWLLIAGVAAARLRGWARLRGLRRAAGALLIGLGTWGVAQASGLGQTLLCF